jgi:hypothetical protein
MNPHRGFPPQRDRILHPADIFIVRIWFEHREKGYGRQIWRGMVEHVTTKERRYFVDLDCLVAFVKEKSGVHKAGGLSGPD